MPTTYSPVKDKIITIVCIFGMLGSTITDNIIVKLQYTYKLPPCNGCPPADFDHAYMMTCLMFVAEACCIVIWLPEHFIAKKKGRIPELTGNRKYFKFFPHVFLFMVPTLCDLIGSTLIQIAVVSTLPSIVAMIRQVVVLFVSLLSLAIFKSYRKTFDLPQGVGIALITIGCVMISYASAMFDSGSSETVAKNNVLGVIMSILGTLFGALFLVTEEVFLKNIEMESSLVVTCEGSWGLIFYAILLPIYQIVDDPFNTTGVPRKMESAYAWWYQTTQSVGLVMLIVVDTLLVLVYNVCGCEITNRITATTRSTFDTIKVIFVWIISIIIGWEVWHNIGSPVRLVGFVVLTVGVFLYNNVTQWLPFLREENKQLYGKCGDQCRRKSKVQAASAEPVDADGLFDSAQLAPVAEQ